MNLKPFEELLAGATPGPWARDGICIQSPKGNVGIVNLARFSETDASYIARCSPSTMREVWEALKSCQYNPSENWGAQHRFDEELVRRATALLNGEKPEGKK